MAYSGVPTDPGEVMESGCVGLAVARLGIRTFPNGGWPTFPFADRNAHFFTSIEDAQEYQQRETPPENPEQLTLIAMQVRGTVPTLPPIEGSPNHGEIDPAAFLNVVQATPGFNVSTDLDNDMGSQRWEYLNHGFEPDVRDDGSVVINEVATRTLYRSNVKLVQDPQLPGNYDSTIFVVMNRKPK